MTVGHLKKVLMVLAILTLCSAPSWAGSFGVYGAYWDSKDASSSGGAGIKVGFNFTKVVELEFHGTYFPDFKDDDFPGQSFDLTAIPVDGGLKLNFIPEGGFNPYVGGGFSRYFLSTDPGSVEDQNGVYLEAGFDAGAAKSEGARFNAEVVWRKVDTPISVGSFDDEIRFDGIGIHAGATWRWGK